MICVIRVHLRLTLFQCFDLCEPSTVSLFATKSRGDKRSHDLHRELGPNHARSQTEHVAIVMFARLARGVSITTERGANTAKLVSRNGRSDTTPANKYPDLSGVVLHRLTN